MSRVWKIFLLLGVVFFLFTILSPAQKYGSETDCEYYLTYAEIVQEKGISGFRSLLSWYSESEYHRYHPFPGRIGYIALVSTVCKVFEPSFKVLSCISIVSFLLYLMISYFYCRKHFGGDMAIAFLVLSSSSPLLLHMSRIAMSDSSVNLLWGTAVWMFLDFLKEPRRLTYWLLTAVMILAILFKESSLILLMFFVLAWLIFKKTKGCSASKQQVFGIVLWVLLFTGVIFLMCLGINGTADAFKALYATHFIDQTNLYATRFSSGPWFRYLVDFLLMSPVTLIAFIAYAGYIVISKRYRWEELYFLLYYVFIYAVLSIPKHSKVVRFVINLDMVMTLFTVFFLFRLLKMNTYREALVVLLLACIFVFNANNFTVLFYKTGVLDPITSDLSRMLNLWQDDI